MAKKSKKQSTSSVDTTIGDEQHKRATAYGVALDGEVSPIIVDLASKSMDIEAGTFDVMHVLTRNLTDEQIEALPDPRTDTGNNPANYKYKVLTMKKGKLTEVVRKGYFYGDIADTFPSVVTKRKRIDLLKRSMDGNAYSDVTQEIRDTAQAYRQSEIDKLERQCQLAKSKVEDAFELFIQLNRIKTDPAIKIDVELVHAIGPDGNYCDGEDGRPFKIESTKTPIQVTSTVPGREKIDCPRVSVGTLLKWNIDKAKEAVGGATLQALENTAIIQKGPDQPIPTATVAVNTLETFVARLNDVNEYATRQMDATDRAGWEALQKFAEKDDDFFWNMAYLYHNVFQPIVNNPKALIRWQSLINNRADKPKAKAA